MLANLTGVDRLVPEERNVQRTEQEHRKREPHCGGDWPGNTPSAEPRLCCHLCPEVSVRARADLSCSFGRCLAQGATHLAGCFLFQEGHLRSTLRLLP